MNLTVSFIYAQYFCHVNTYTTVITVDLSPNYLHHRAI